VWGGGGGGGGVGDEEGGVGAGVGGKKGGQHAGQGIGHLLDAGFRDPAECGQGDCDLIGGHSQGLAVEIPAADDVAVAVFLYEDQRVVGSAIQFDLREIARLRETIAHGSVNLRGAAE